MPLPVGNGRACCGLPRDCGWDDFQQNKDSPRRSVGPARGRGDSGIPVHLSDGHWSCECPGIYGSGNRDRWRVALGRVSCLGNSFRDSGWTPLLALVAAALFPIGGACAVDVGFTKGIPCDGRDCDTRKPVGAATLAFLFLNEVPTGVVIGGSALALVGMMVVFSAGSGSSSSTEG